MKKISAEQQEWFLFAIVLLIGTLLMLIAGQFALQLPHTWQISDTNMDSNLNPNEVYAVYRKDYDFRLAPIRTDIPNLLATVANAAVTPGSVLPPPPVEFKAPAQIATTTPFPWSSVTAAANTPQTPGASATALPAASETPLPTATLQPTATPWPTITPRRTATRIRTPNPTPWPTSTDEPTSAPQPSATHTATPAPSLTQTATHTYTPTATYTPVDTATATLTPTETATATATFTATATTPLSSCVSAGGGSYTIPIGGCKISYDTTAQGAILSLDMIGSGNISANWFGLLENQTTGTCADQNSKLTPGITLSNIAVAKAADISIVITNPTSKAITIQVTVSDWLVGNCQ